MKYRVGGSVKGNTCEHDVCGVWKSRANYASCVRICCVRER